MKKISYRSEPKCFRINNRDVYEIVKLLPHGKLSEIINECLEEYFINNKNMQITKVGDINDRNKQWVIWELRV